VREAVRLKPDNAGARENLARLLAVTAGLKRRSRSFGRRCGARPPRRPPHGPRRSARRGRDHGEGAGRAYDEALRLARKTGARISAPATPRASPGEPATRSGTTSARSRRFRGRPPPLRARERLAAAGRSGEAIVRYLEGLEMDPRDALAQYDVGTLLARAGRVAESLPHLAEAVRLRPDFEDARRNLALARSLLGEP